LLSILSDSQTLGLPELFENLCQILFVCSHKIAAKNQI
jgi:hypothetical protein